MKTSHGFTLIELMIVVAIVSILASVALPAYNDYITRSKLTEAHGELAAMRTKLEQYFLDNRSYTGACAAGTVAPLPTGKYFTYNCPTLSDTQYTVQATGNAAQGMAGFAFTINEANVRATTGAPAGWSTNPTCWIRQKGALGC